MRKKIKVALVAEVVWPESKYGGFGKYAGKLISHLSNRMDIELHIITLSEVTAGTKADNFRVHTIKKRGKAAPILLMPSIKRKIWEINPDIANSLSARWSTALALLRERYPVTTTVLGLIPMDNKYDLRINTIDGAYTYIYNKLIGYRNEKYVLEKIPNIIVESSPNGNIVSKMTSSKIHVIPDGIEFSELQQIKPTSKEKPDLFFVGGLYRVKGVDLLIKAIPKVLETFPNLTISIAGAGTQMKELRALVDELQLNEHVRFLGFIPEDDKFRYMKAARAVVVPSRWDFSPITIYEAMACGRPVIASNVTNSDILEDGVTGFLFESENVEDLAAKMVRLLGDEGLRERMGKAALERARECDWSKIAERHVEVYREVIADFHERKAKNS